ncbi:Acyl carrier protein [Actinokineospora spheciospongiae]|uniref:Acyl carrier protein n=1 Tax=Actinokineospora spheciospongiae TaxID=909613 RepID=W7J1B3_9PSEU|nr:MULTISPECIES: phosphopantetheine-binding protein [Actinokineospora]EWC62832.1 Acyl carrier protein [Actinokineospora spheciospongiae]MCG8916301.1 phosphopantetheine-binding protein [Actinokineospora sp. PR83]PWW62463.1 acyl carrier protein [Actinokineospora spheciospongiae]
MTSPMYDTLVDLLVTRFEVDRAEISPEVTFEDLDMDSLFLVELLVVIQTETGVEISEDTASPRDTIGHAAEAIAAQVLEATAAKSS